MKGKSMKSRLCLSPFGSIAAIPKSTAKPARCALPASMDRVRLGRAARWLVIFLLLPGAESFGQTPGPEALQQMRIAHPPVVGGQLTGVAWDGGAWVAVGSRSTILRSEDGLEWQPQAAKAEVCFRSVTSGNGTLLALTHCSTAMISRDGLQWERKGSPGLHVRSAAFGQGVFVGVGDSGTIVVSSNAVAWAPRAMSSSESLHSVRYAGDRFVAVGARGVIVSSTDGRQWKPSDSKTTRSLHGLAYGEGIWVAVGCHGVVVTSTDGEHWTPRESGTTESLRAVAFGGTTFLAVGWNGCLLASRDARDWRSLPSSEGNLCDVAYGCDHFVAVGQRNTILLVGQDLEGHNLPSQ
jgi:hypothetical protein